VVEEVVLLPYGLFQAGQVVALGLENIVILAHDLSQFGTFLIPGDQVVKNKQAELVKLRNLLINQSIALMSLVPYHFPNTQDLIRRCVNIFSHRFFEGAGPLEIPDLNKIA